MKPLFSLIVVLCLAACGEPAERPGHVPVPPPDGGLDFDGDAAESVLRLAPNEGYLGGGAIVSVEGGSWRETPELDFGPDIEVTDVRLQGPQQLTARIQIGPLADTGVRSVLVGSEEGPLPVAFTVSPSLAVTVQGSGFQGSLLDIQIEGLDPERLPGVWPFAIGEDLIADLGFEGALDRTVVLVAPGAAPGPRPLVWSSPLSEDRLATEKDAVEILGRPPEEISPGEHAAGPLESFDARSYHFAVAEPSIVLLSATGYSVPVLWLFGEGGREGDYLGVRRAELEFGEEPAAVDEIPALAASGSEGFVAVAHPRMGLASAPNAFDLRLDVVPAVRVDAETTDVHDSNATAQDASACTAACVIVGILPAGQTHVFRIPPRPDFGYLVVGLIADHGLRIKGGYDGTSPATQTVWALYGHLAPPVSFEEWNYPAPYFLTVRGPTGGASPLAYRFSVRRAAP